MHGRPSHGHPFPAPIKSNLGTDTRKSGDNPAPTVLLFSVEEVQECFADIEPAHPSTDSRQHCNGEKEELQ